MNNPNSYSYRLRVCVGERPLSIGTAFFLTQDVVATAFHVIGDEHKGNWHSDDKANVTYTLEGPECALELEPIIGYPAEDVAILRLKVGPHEAVTLQTAYLSDLAPEREARWHTTGYPAVSGGEPFPITGNISGINPKGRARAIALIIDAGTDIDWGGISGAPVVTDDGVVGLITQVTSHSNTGWASTTEPLWPLLELHKTGLVEKIQMWLLEQLPQNAQIEALRAALNWQPGLACDAGPALLNWLVRHAFQGKDTKLWNFYEQVHAQLSRAIPDELSALAHQVTLVPHRPNRAQRIVQAAGRRALEASRKRIADDRKYVERQYVEREAVQSSFSAFLAQNERPCFLIVGKAGAGKTTALSSLALHPSAGPALFFRGGSDPCTKDDILGCITATLIEPQVAHESSPRNWDELMSSLRLCGAQLLLFIDAINETRFEEIQERRKELKLLLEYIVEYPIRLIVSCRDVFWTHFHDEFWWHYVHDATYETRLEETTARLRAEYEETNRRPSRPDSPIDDKRMQELREIARRRVFYRPSLMLGDFKPQELEQAFARYELTAPPDKLATQLRHPLLLYLYSESATLADAQELFTLGDLLRRYVDYKLDSVQRAYSLYNPGIVRRFVSQLVSNMRTRRYGKLEASQVDIIMQENPQMQAVRKHLLDEGILFEQSGDRAESPQLIGFQFDAVFEYMLAREIGKELSEATDIERLGSNLLVEAAHFESMVGALEFVCAKLEKEDPERCWKFLTTVAKGTSFAKESFLRVSVHLRDPLVAQSEQAWLAALDDREVDEDLTTKSIGNILEKHPQLVESFVERLVAPSSDFAGERCAAVIARPASLPSRSRVALARALLKLPSYCVASAVGTNLAHGLGMTRLFPQKPRIETADLTLLTESARQGNITLMGLHFLVAEVLPSLVGEVPAGFVGDILSSMLLHDDFTFNSYVGNVSDLVAALIKNKSEDLQVLVDVSKNRPTLLLPICGLIEQAITNAPQQQVWVCACLARNSLQSEAGGYLPWFVLYSLAQHTPDLAARVEAALGSKDAEQMRLRLQKLGIRPGEKVDLASRFALLTSTGVLTSLLYSFAVSPWLADLSPGYITAPLLAISGGHFAAITFLVLANLYWIRFSAKTKWTLTGVCSVAIVGLLNYHPSWLCVATLSVGTAGYIVKSLRPYTHKKLLVKIRFFMHSVLLGLALTAPTAWLSQYMQWKYALIAISAPVVMSNIVVIDAIYMLANTSLLAAINGTLTFIVIIISASISNKRPYLILPSIFAMLILCIWSVLQQERKMHVMKGFVGPWLLILGTALALGVVVLAVLNLWIYVITLSALAAMLLLPVSTTKAWIQFRAGPAIVGIVIGGAIGLVIKWRWRVESGLPELYAQLVWISFCYLSPVAIFFGVVALKRQRDLKNVMDRPH